MPLATLWNLGLALALVVGVAPQLDADASGMGAGVSGAQLAILPHGRGAADALAQAATASVSTGTLGDLGANGLSLMMPLTLSVQGYSWTQLHHRWGGVAMDDPSQAGQPWLQLPLGALSRLLVQGAWSHGPTLGWQTEVWPVADHRPSTQIRLQGAALRGGDGEAATPRRTLRSTREGQAVATVPVGAGTLFLLGEHLEQDIRTPVPPALVAAGARVAGAAQALGARRDTAVAVFGQRLGGFQLEIRGALQGRRRHGYARMLRWPAPYLSRQHEHVWLVQAELKRRLRGGSCFAAGVGLGGRAAHARPLADAPADVPVAEDLLARWLLLALPRPPQQSYAVGLDAYARWLWRPRRLPAPAGQRLPFGAGPAPSVQVDAATPRPTSLLGGRAPGRFFRDPKRPAPARPQLADVSPLHSSTRPVDPSLPLLSLEPPTVRSHPAGATVRLELAGRLAGYRRQTRTPAPAWTLLDAGTPQQITRYEAAEGEVRTMMLRCELAVHYVFRPRRQAAGRAGSLPRGPRRRDGGPAILEVVGGLDAASLTAPVQQVARVAPRLGLSLRGPLGPLHGFVLARREPEALTQQLGDALGGDGLRGFLQPANSEAVPVGGLNHLAAHGLRAPSHHLLQLGLSYLFGRGWGTGVRATGHLLAQRYLLRRAGAATGAVVLAGSTPAAPAAWQLANDAQRTLYLGAEWELHSPTAAAWFVGLTAAAMTARGRAPFGTAAWQNDPGVLAAPAQGVNDAPHAWGRHEHDRTYAVQLQAGVRPLPGLTVATVGRLRGGLPFARLAAVASGDAPAPRLAQRLEARGRQRTPPRLLWDVRLRYATQSLGPFALTVLLDVYNLLNAATALDQDPRVGATFGQALEALPARSGWLGIELAFLP